MTDHIANREIVIKALREELVGPSPQGEQIDCRKEVAFTDAQQSYGPWTQLDSGEEILQRDPPTKRYGIAVLYPAGTGYDSVSAEEYSHDDTDGLSNSDSSYSQIADSTNTSTDEKDIETLEGIEAESDDFDLSTTNSFKPSSMAVSFLVDFSGGSELIVEASGGEV